METKTPASTRRIDDPESIGTVVAEAIADADSTDPLQMEPLYESIDIEAVDALLRSSDAQVTISFDHKEYAVNVVSGSRVEVFT